MIKNKNKQERKEDLSSNHKNDKKIILITHSKNKSVDFKLSKITNYLSSTRDNLTEEKFKTNLNPRYKLRINLKREKEINNSILQLHKSISNLKKSLSPKKSINKKIKNSLLKKYVSIPNLIEKNKKKYFLEPNFFKNIHKEKKLNPKIFIKKFINNSNFSLIKNKKEKKKYSKRIIKRNNMSENNNKNNRKKEEIYNGKKIKENEDSKNCDISSNDNNSYCVKDFDIKKTKIKSNRLYIKGKIEQIPYKNKKCSSSRISSNLNKNKINNNKIESIIKINGNKLNDSLDSHNTIYDEDIININDYNLVNNKSSINKNIEDKIIFANNDKLYKKIISRKRNILTESLNNSNLNKKLSRCYSSKIYNFKNVNSKKISCLSNNNINQLTSSSLLTTQYQTNKDKEKTNIIINKDVTEFLYTEDMIEGIPQIKEENLRKWLADINLSFYYQNFYEANIYINELINKMKETENKKQLYEFIENTFHIHIPGHIYRILLKLEVDAGLLDKKISHFLIEENDENRIKINNLKPSLLLNKYNSCAYFLNYYGYNNSSIIKSKLKYFLKKYHLLNLYYNYNQNGFDIINFVLLQMFSNYYSIDDNILENCFHIYNINDRFLVMEALLNEKEKINSFINSDNNKKDYNKSNLKYDNIFFNNSFFNNMDNYFPTNESERSNCNICNIY